jgi:hypothetical protein
MAMAKTAMPNGTPRRIPARRRARLLPALLTYPWVG